MKWLKFITHKKDGLVPARKPFSQQSKEEMRKTIMEGAARFDKDFSETMHQLANE